MGPAVPRLGPMGALEGLVASMAVTARMESSRPGVERGSAREAGEEAYMVLQVVVEQEVDSHWLCHQWREGGLPEEPLTVRPLYSL